MEKMHQKSWAKGVSNIQFLYVDFLNLLYKPEQQMHHIGNHELFSCLYPVQLYGITPSLDSKRENNKKKHWISASFHRWRSRVLFKEEKRGKKTIYFPSATEENSLQDDALVLEWAEKLLKRLLPLAEHSNHTIFSNRCPVKQDWITSL